VPQATHLRNFACIASVLMIAACSGGTTGPSVPGSQSVPSIAAKTVAASTEGASEPRTLYVSNILGNSVEAFTTDGQLIASATNLLKDPNGVAVSPNGEVYVANYGERNIQVYSRRLKRLLNTITSGVTKPHVVLTDGTGTLYASMSRDVRVYPDGTTKGNYRIWPGGGSIALDRNNNLYVASSDGVRVYDPGKRQKSRIINTPTGIIISAIGVDGMGTLYVGANSVPHGAGPCSSAVFVYDASSGKLLRTLTQDICYPASIAFDAQQNVYIGNVESIGSYSTGITEFAVGTTTMIEQITTGATDPVSIAIDPTGNLYVANLEQNTVTIFSPGKTSPRRTIHKGMKDPGSIALGN
jgi:sugar lactone lactonase YvrE